MTAEAPFQIPSSSAEKGKWILVRLGRAFFWSKPLYYRWLGRLRNRGDCLSRDFDVWIDGFPRSANTFTTTLFHMANPAARISSHRHIPTFVVSALHAGKPGILLLRKPEDAAISWAIFWKMDVTHCLDYYIDFHRVLRPYVSDLFVAPFEQVTADFPAVIDAFNRFYKLNYSSATHDAATMAECMSKVEALSREEGGGIDESRVGRPSSQREPAKVLLRKRIYQSPDLYRKLEKASELHGIFHAVAKSRLGTMDAALASHKNGAVSQIPAKLRSAAQGV